MTLSTGVVRWGLVLAAIWLPWWWRVAEVWRVDPEMRHGWWVPVLVAYLAWLRRDGMPPRESGETRGTVPVLGGALVGLAVVSWVVEANPLWPRLLWLGTGFAIGATGALMLATEGRSRARYWAGSLGLLLLALPWPTAVQRPVALGLATANAHLAAEVVSGLGYPAAVHGRIIEVATGVAGVEEACSGIRSLQTVTMAAIFLAVYLALGWRRGLLLVGAGWLVAVGGNLIRTCYLVLVLAKEGVEPMNAVHDAAGNSVLIVTLLIMALAAWHLPIGIVANGMPRANPDRLTTVGGLGRASVAAVVLFGLTAQGAIWNWYAEGSRGRERVGWTWADRADWRPAAVPRSAAEALGYTAGSGRAWSDLPEGGATLAFLFHWDGDLRNLGGATLHDPTLCLPGIGSRLVRELPEITRSFAGGEIGLSAYRFRTVQGRSQFVFFQIWDAFRAEPWRVDAREDWQSARWQRVWDRRRRSDVYQIFIVIEAELDDAEALERGRQRFEKILMPERE